MDKKMWDAVRFAEMFKYNPRSAFEYRKACLGEEIPDEYLTDEELKNKEITPEKEVDREELKNKLKEANIEFFNNAKTDKLLELCIENNLL